MKKVKETGISIDKTKREERKTVCTSENIAAVAESVCRTVNINSLSFSAIEHFGNIIESRRGLVGSVLAY